MYSEAAVQMKKKAVWRRLLTSAKSRKKRCTRFIRESWKMKKRDKSSETNVDIKSGSAGCIRVSKSLWKKLVLTTRARMRATE